MLLILQGSVNGVEAIDRAGVRGGFLRKFVWNLTKKISSSSN